MSAQRMSGCDRIQKKTVALDLYRTPFLFLLPDSAEQYRTFLGAILSVLTLIALLVYGSYKFLVLLDLTDYKVQTAISETYYDFMEGLPSTQGFNVAAAITTYDGSSEVVEDPDYGEVKFYIKSFGLGEPGVIFDELPVRICDPATDFNYADDNNPGATFYRANPANGNDLKTYGGKMKCIDTDFELLGNYNTEAAKNLMVAFVRCDSIKRTTCHGDPEIDEWMSTKYMITL